MSDFEDKDSNTSIDTGWINPPKLSDLQGNYTDGLLEHDVQQAKVDTWLNNLNITGTAKKKKIEGKSNIQPKLIRKQAEWRYPALTEPFLSTDDIFNVYPVTAADVAQARQNQIVLNNQFNTKINKVKFIDDFVRAGVDEGTIIVRVGWVFEEQIIQEEQPVYEFIPDPTGQALQQYQMLIELQKTDLAKFKEYSNPGIVQALEILSSTGQIVIPQQVSVETVEKTVTINNHPTVDVCEHNNIVVDPSCNGDLDKAGFIIYSFETSRSELNKNKHLYHNIDKIRVDNATPLNTVDYTASADNSNFTFKDDARIKFIVREYWGYWDYNDTGIAEPFVASWVGDTLIRMEVSPFPDKKLPFVLVPYMPVRRSLYGEPDGELLTDNQNIIGAITRGMIDLMGKSAAGQTGTRKDFLDAVNSKKYREGRDYLFNGNVDPRVGVFQHTYPEIPQSAYNMLNIQNAEAESLSGVKAYNSGITGNSLGDVAAGIRGALDAASRRETSILRRLAQGIITIGRKIISLNAALLSDEEVIRITDSEFVTVKRDDLAGNFDLKLSISTAEEDNAKAQELAFMLQTGAASADPGEVRMIRAEIARLRKMPDLAKRIEEYQPQPDPLQQAEAQLKIKLLEAQIAKEQAMARKHDSATALDQLQARTMEINAGHTLAKTETEKAKARQTHSDADSKDLDYLEQESGVHQERALQKIHGQAESQTKMKIIEAMLNKKKENNTFNGKQG